MTERIPEPLKDQITDEITDEITNQITNQITRPEPKELPTGATGRGPMLVIVLGLSTFVTPIMNAVPGCALAAPVQNPVGGQP